MLDPKKMRHNTEAFQAALARRDVPPQRVKEFLDLDDKQRDLTTQVQNLRTQRKHLAKQSTTSQQESLALRTELRTCEDALRHTQEHSRELLAHFPNLPLDDVPDGTNPQEIRRWGNQPTLDNPKSHDVVGGAFMDFDAARRISGARFVTLRGPLARLERALGNFMVDIHTREFGYEEISPPLLVRPESLFGTGQLPKFAQEQFRTEDDLWLIPTAETPLTNLLRESFLDEGTLPLRVCALTPCFRREAGAAGRDTHGMIRQHQFSKVELVTITTPEHSHNELERMTQCAEDILKRLELPFRVMLLAAQDMGFAASKTYDLEVWLPSQNTYREISSCSLCGDFQARRMKTRLRTPDRKGTRFPHTLNGSGVAVGRTLIALLENRQTTQGLVTIPPALQPYMDGMDVLDLKHV